MILGKITGKLTPTIFRFLVDGEAKQFDYVQVYHKDYDYVLAQIVELERDDDKTLAHCAVIGYMNDDGQVKSIRSPFEPGSEVLLAEDEFLSSIIKLDENRKGAFIGRLDGRNIDIFLDMRELLTKHVAVLAKSGAGKSYTVGVLLEEILEQKVPLLIIDPHGEYNSLKYPNEGEEKRLALFGKEAKGFKNIVEYGDPNVNEGVRPLMVTDSLTSSELTHILPGKVSSTQLGILHTAIQDREAVQFGSVLSALAIEENNAKWTLIAHIEHLQRMGIFSSAPTDYTSMIQPGQATILNMRGIPPDIQEIVVYKIMKDLFELRKKEKVPPFFTVIEEAHNYCPERSFGETKCSKILRNIASEGRKFGLGLCVVSQRPARVDKSVLSQCTTQIILKITNPNDLKAVVNSVEGITSESEREIQNLPIGNALVTGVVDVPLFTEIRPRATKHGGAAAEMIEEPDLMDKFEEFENKDMLPVIRPKMTKKDIEVMSDEEIEKIDTILIPAIRVSCRSGQRNFTLALELLNGGIITNIEKKQVQVRFLPPLFDLTRDELSILEQTLKNGQCTPKDASQTSVLSGLVKKKLLTEHGSIYRANNRWIFSSLDKANFPYKVEYQEIHYDRKIEGKKDKEKILNELKRYTEVTDVQDCFVVHYDIKQKK